MPVAKNNVRKEPIIKVKKVKKINVVVEKKPDAIIDDKYKLVELCAGTGAFTLGF